LRRASIQSPWSGGSTRPPIPIPLIKLTKAKFAGNPGYSLTLRSISPVNARHLTISAKANSRQAFHRPPEPSISCYL
jgi:hypothetical protein